MTSDTSLVCRYVGCVRGPSPVPAGDPTARWALCAVHRPLVREALAPGAGMPPRLAVREIEVGPGDVRVLVGPT